MDMDWNIHVIDGPNVKEDIVDLEDFVLETYVAKFIKVKEEVGDEHEVNIQQNFKVREENNTQDFKDDIEIKEEEVFYDPESGSNLEIDTLCQSPIKKDSVEDQDIIDTLNMQDHHENSKTVKINNIKTLDMPADTEIVYNGSTSQTPSTKVHKICITCGSPVVNLARHLRIHNLPESEVKKISFRARIRKQTLTRKPRKCPFPLCQGLAPHSRLDKHFKEFHKIRATDPIYRKYFRSRRAHAKSEDTYLNNITETYKCHLKGFGGRLSEAVAHSQSLKLKQILLGCEITNINTITDSLSVQKLQKWFFDYASTHNPKSAITYISILLNYLEFLKDAVKFDSEELENLNSKLRKMKKLVIKLNRSRIGHNKKVVSPNEIRNFNTSETIKGIEEIIRSCQEVKQITKAVHSQVRNYLMIRILIRSFCRSGVIANLKIEQYVNKETIDEGGQKFYIIHCNEHKTYKTRRSTSIILTEELAAQLDIYYKTFRPFILRKNHNMEKSSFFLTWTAKKLASDDVNRGVRSLWKEAGCVGKIGATILRMSRMSSIYRQCESHEKDLVVRSQCHQPAKTERYFRSSTMSVEAVKASNTANKHLCDISTQDISHDGKSIEEICVGKYDKAQEGDATYNMETSCCELDPCEESPPLDSEEHAVQTSNTIENKNNDWKLHVCRSDGRGRIFFSLCERIIILNHFIEDIEMGRVPTLSTIRRELENNESLKEINGKHKDIAPKVKGAILNILNKKQNRDNKLRKSLISV